MKQYAAPLPIDRMGTPLQEYPAANLALSRYAVDNASASSVITLTDNTTVVEVAATTTAAAVRWVAIGDTQASVVSAAGATANFDHIIPANSFRRFVVPMEKAGVASIVGLNKQNGLYNRLAVKSVGIGSVATIEF